MLFPKKSYCPICDSETKDILCKSCAQSIKFMNGRTCLKCGKALDDIYNDYTCPDCKVIIHHFHSAYSCFQYEGMGKALIHAFKYKGRTQICELLAGYMCEKMREEKLTGDYLIAVPIHHNKLQKRGFNQSSLIAESLSKKIHIKSIDCLRRDKETEKQHKLNRDERFQNVYNAFSGEVSYNIKNKSILLIDDIYTTGSTADECSRILKSMGAAKIVVITVASGKNT